MTSAPDPAPGGRRPRLPWVLLILSVALNLFFIGSVGWLHLHDPHRPEAASERVEWVAKQLSLSPEQRAEFDSFLAILRSKTRDMHEVNTPLIDQAWDEYAKAEPDETVIARLIQEAADHRRDSQVEIGHALRAFLATLSQDQRMTMIHLIKDRPKRDMPPLLRQLAQ